MARGDKSQQVDPEAKKPDEIPAKDEQQAPPAAPVVAPPAKLKESLAVKVAPAVVNIPADAVRAASQDAKERGETAIEIIAYGPLSVVYHGSKVGMRKVAL